LLLTINFRSSFSHRLNIVLTLSFIDPLSEVIALLTCLGRPITLKLSWPLLYAVFSACHVC